MRVSFFGAAGEVTGSAFLVQTDQARVLVDFGLHQGEKEADEHNRMPPELDARRLDAVVLTHAHLDHSGRLPMLVQAGYAGEIHATPATIELVDILLRDTVNLMEQDARRANRHAGGDAIGPVRPLYGMEEAEAAMRMFRGLRYTEPRRIAPGISIRLFDAGHILGSASVEMTVEEQGGTKVVVFSGDIGPRGLPLLHDPTLLKRADVAFLESTYGDREHRSREETVREFEEILTVARRTSGKVLIPAFAVGRTQDIIHEMVKLYCAGRFKNPSVYVDSPMATDVTGVYRGHCDLWDADARKMRSEGCTPLSFPGLRFIRTAEESKRLNELGNGTVIIAGSGMCTGGRIVHHLRNDLWREETHVVIAGFQAQGTLGRRLVDGQKNVRIYGDEIAVKARIHTLGGFSAHAGQSGLMEWAMAFAPPPARMVLTHGEPRARDALHARIKREIGVDAERPLLRDTIEL